MEVPKGITWRVLGQLVSIDGERGGRGGEGRTEGDTDVRSRSGCIAAYAAAVVPLIWLPLRPEFQVPYNNNGTKKVLIIPDRVVQL